MYTDSNYRTSCKRFLFTLREINKPVVPQLQLMTVRISRVTEDMPTHHQIYWTSSAHMRMQFAFFLSEYIPPSEVVRQQYGERDEEKQRWRTRGRREFSSGNTVSVKINTRGPKVKEEVKKQISPTIRASQLPVGTWTTKKDFPRQVCACVCTSACTCVSLLEKST